jgi:uncharacterized protein YegL
MKTLPIYLLLDTSHSMEGDPIQALSSGIAMFHQNLMNNPLAVETVSLSVITFGGNPAQVVPLTAITQFQPPRLQARGGICLEAGIDLLCDCLEREVTISGPERDWRPIIFATISGKPEDDWERAAARCGTGLRCCANLVILVVGDFPDTDFLKAFPGTRLWMRDSAPDSFASYIEWSEIMIPAED